MNQKFNTFIFDLDGTLLDSLVDIANGVNHGLQKYGFPQRSNTEIRNILGRGYRYLIEHALPENSSEQDYEHVYQAFRSFYEQHCFEHTGPYPGIMDVLNKLQEKGIKMAIVSNKGNEAVQQLAKRFFDQLIPIAVGESKEIRRKPAPDTVLKAIQDLGSSLDDCCYVGDSEVDFQTAVNANIPCLSCTWGFRSKLFLQEIGANIFLQKAEDLLLYAKD